jgi:hypothetical protein
MGKVTETIPITGKTFMKHTTKSLKLPDLSFTDRLGYIELMVQPNQVVTCSVRHWVDKDPNNPQLGLKERERDYFLQDNLEWKFGFEQDYKSSWIKDPSFMSYKSIKQPANAMDYARIQ